VSFSRKYQQYNLPLGELLLCHKGKHLENYKLHSHQMTGFLFNSIPECSSCFIQDRKHCLSPNELTHQISSQRWCVWVMKSREVE